ncbi:hypothetical protein D3C79_1091880 [compost metagenome]
MPVCEGRCGQTGLPFDCVRLLVPEKNRQTKHSESDHDVSLPYPVQGNRRNDGRRGEHGYGGWSSDDRQRPFL